MKVLLGVDGSAGSGAAAQFVGQLLSAEKDEILLYYSPPTIHLKSAEPIDPQLAQRVQHLLDRAVFENARRCLPAAMRDRVREIAGSQKPAYGILVAADEHRVDLIAVGARGAGRLSEPSVGSVARSLAHHARIPALIVRQSSEADLTRPLRILLASDGSPASRHCAQIVANFSWPAGTMGRVLTVVESPLEGRIPQWLEDRIFQEEAEAIGLGHFEPTSHEQRMIQEHLIRWCGELPSAFQSLPPLVTIGHARQAIIEAIRSERADLVVVGARGRGAIGRMLLGSTSEHLLLHAPCSILIAREHEKP